jgi:chromosome segregation ATPase
MKARKPQISKEIYEFVVSIVDDKLKGIVATRAEFEALKDSLDKLVEAQRRTEEAIESFKRVTEENFNRVWKAINELAEAQRRTEERLNQLVIRVDELTERLSRLTDRVDQLAEAQRKTEERLNQLTIRVDELTDRLNKLTERVDQLAEAQRRTEEKLAQLAEAQLKTEQSLNKVRMDLAGLSRSVSYAFENEAFRNLPRFLKERYGIEVIERLIRKEVGGKEINLLGRAKKNGEDVIIVGEVKMRLESKKYKEEFEADIFDELEEKVEVVKAEYGDIEVVKILVTHYASESFLKLAREKGVIVVQSFEW